MLNEILRNNGIEKIKSYINCNDDLLKDTTLSSGSFETNSAEYYLYYPYLFIEAFDSIDLSKLVSLNIASYFCYRYVVLKDEIIDHQISDDLVNGYELLAKCYMKHALQILQGLFDTESLFWLKWSIRKEELDKTTLLDKTLDSTDYSEEIFKEFAWNKSGFAKLAIDALYVLSGQKNADAYQLMLNSHKEFSCAMQLYDDLFDVIEDQIHPQFNFAKYQIYLELDRIGIDKERLTKADIENYLFVSGKDAEVLNIALECILNARELSMPYKNLAWENVLNFYERIFITVRRSMNTYLKRIYAEKNNSNLPLIEIPLKLSIVELKNSLEKGLEFLYSRRNENGSWDEYITSAGTSDVWSTGFITLMSKDFIDEQKLAGAKYFIVTNASPYWGYREKYVNDIDSTNFALLTLGSDTKYTHYIDFLYKWQNIDGGLPTYPLINIGMLRKAMKASDSDVYIGWTQSHPCVTSVSFYLLNSIKHDVNPSRILAIESYFINCFEKEEKLVYWWTNEIYSLYFLVLSFKHIKSQILKRSILNRLNIIIIESNEDGSIGDKFNKKSAFYTAFLILSMIELDRMCVKDYKNEIHKSICWIISNQLKDGSWKETNALQIPEPTCIVPENIDWVVSEYGCNIRAIEFNRLFTTSVCLKAVYEFKRSN